MPSCSVLAGSNWCIPVPEPVNVAVTLYSCDLVTICRQDIRIFPQFITFLHLLCSSTLVFGALKPLGQCFLIRGPRFECILVAESEVSFLFQAVRNLCVAVYIEFLQVLTLQTYEYVLSVNIATVNVSTASVQGVEN